MEAIKAFLDSSVDTTQLQGLKKASNLVEESNSDKKPDIKKAETDLLSNRMKKAIRSI